MAKRGAKLKADRPSEWKLSLPSSITAPVELILSDPLTGRPKHGARARLVAKLLKEWLEEQSGSAIKLDN